jgi:hypothetical protein
MHIEGQFAPASAAEARRLYAELGGAAGAVVREAVKAMDFDREEYNERVTDDVRSTARDALFASLLEVRVGDREAFESWRATFDGDCRVMGSDGVPNVVWHVVPFGATGPPDRAADDNGGRNPPGSRTESGEEAVTPVAVAATFQDEPEAAKATLQRTVFGRVYHEVIHADPVGTGAHSTEPPEDEDGAEGGGE